MKQVLDVCMSSITNKKTKQFKIEINVYKVISIIVDFFCRGVRERQLQKAVARLQEYANSSCQTNNEACEYFPYYFVSTVNPRLSAAEPIQNLTILTSCLFEGDARSNKNQRF